MRVLIIIVVLAVIALGAWLIWGNDATPAGETSEETTEVTEDKSDGDTAMEDEEPKGDPIFHALVDYTDEGFSPSETTIKKGETVRFVNNHSSRDVWIGSDIHPTHSVYPAKTDDDCLGSSFDTCRGLKAAEFWEFTFDEVGEWGFHDHLKANEKGKIIVTE